jgi:RNA polymerase sigma-70 factor (ECF subfamily)
MSHEDTAGLLESALAGDRAALAGLVAGLTPVIQARVARTLLTRRAFLPPGRNVRQDVEDLSQDVFLALFNRNAHVLRDWQAERGLSLENFVGLVAERQVISFLRSGRRNPRQEVPAPAYDDESHEMEIAAPDVGPEEIAAGREHLAVLLDRLREEVSPLGRRLFDLLFVQELSLPEVRAASGLSADAVYAWRSRLRRVARKLWSELSGKALPARKTWGDGNG